MLGRLFAGWGEPSPLVTPLLVFTIFGTLALQFVPAAAGGPPAGAVLPPEGRRAGRCARFRPARHHHVRTRRRRPLHLLPVLMADAPTPPHHVDWESPPEFAARPHAALPAPADGGSACRWTRVLALGGAAFAVWFLLFAPTLQHNAQVSPVGTRRTVSLDITGPVAALSRALQLSHFVSITGRGTACSGGAAGLTDRGRAARPAASPTRPTPAPKAGGPARHDADDGAAQPQGADRGQPTAGADRRRLHRHRPGRRPAVRPGQHRGGQRGAGRSGQHRA